MIHTSNKISLFINTCFLIVSVLILLKDLGFFENINFTDCDFLNHHESLINSSENTVCETNMSIIGHDDKKKELVGIIKLLKNKNSSKLLKHPNCILLHGPPGTGKTMMACEIYNHICNAYPENKILFLKITPDIIESKFVGEGFKYVKAIFTLAKKKQPCVIFFDELDGILSTRTELDQSYINTTKTLFLTLFDEIINHKIIFIGTTNRLDSLDPAVLRRFTLKIKMDLPTFSERQKLYDTLLSDEQLTDDFDSTTLAEKSENMSHCDITEQLKRSARNRFINDVHSPWTVDDILF